jgi:hypothetical protein
MSRWLHGMDCKYIAGVVRGAAQGKGCCWNRLVERMPQETRIGVSQHASRSFAEGPLSGASHALGKVAVGVLIRPMIAIAWMRFLHFQLRSVRTGWWAARVRVASRGTQWSGVLHVAPACDGHHMCCGTSRWGNGRGVECVRVRCSSVRRLFPESRRPWSWAGEM